MKRRIASAMLALCLAMGLLPVSAFAADETIVATAKFGAQGDNLTCTLDSEGTLTISGVGEMGDAVSWPWSKSPQPNSVISNDDIRTIKIADGVTSIGEFAFAECYNLSSVSIPSSLTTIGAYAFHLCLSITSIEIPSGVKNIGTMPFYCCVDLAEITVDKNNTAYTAVDGVLFTKDLTTLVAYPVGSIRDTYTIPDGVVKISAGAFIRCTNLTSVKVPLSVTTIGWDATRECGNLKYVYYPGTREQWEEIQILDRPGGDNYNNDVFSHAAIFCAGDDLAGVVSYDANGGTGTMEATFVGVYDEYKFPACGFTPPEGQSFKAWSVDGVEYAPNTAYTVTDDTTVYAQWTKETEDPNAYTITFEGNGGKFSNGEERRTQDTGADGKLKEKPEEPTQTGHTFTGWFTSASGGSERNDAYQYTADTTVYAQWTPDDNGTDNPFTPIGPFTVTFNANGGSGGTTMKTGTDGKLSSLPKDPARSGYTFDGWYFDATEGLKIYTSTVFRADTTVYAHWTQNSSSSTNPSNPSNPNNPSNPSTPSGGSYQIVTPGSVYGGSYNVSHTSAPAGTVVTIQVTPWSNYTLGQLSVTRTDTNRAVYTTRYGSEYTFTMPDSDVRLTITYNLSYTGGYVPNQPTTSRYVNWYYSGGNTYHVTSGLVPTGSALTRDMFISILYNLDGSGSGDRDPTIWAATNDIVPDIIMSELWGADKSITREQTAMILYCYAQYKGYSTSQTMSLSGYRDARQIRSMAVPAMAWCCATGLMTGTSANTLSPLGTLTCGQANVIISRFLSGVAR